MGTDAGGAADAGLSNFVERRRFDGDATLGGEASEREAEAGERFGQGRNWKRTPDFRHARLLSALGSTERPRQMRAGAEWIAHRRRAAKRTET
jgi:hypothetical protein